MIHKKSLGVIAVALLLLLAVSFGCAPKLAEEAKNPPADPGPSVSEPAPNAEKPPVADERDFDANARFAALEATFNGISVETTQEELVAKLGEPVQIVELPLDTDINRSIYVYEGVEFYFRGDSSTVGDILVNGRNLPAGPRNIRVGDSFEEVLSRFPQEQDYKTHPNGCFYGEDTYMQEGGAVYGIGGDELQITVVPKEVLPFMKIYFQDGIVDHYVIYGETT